MSSPRLGVAILRASAVGLFAAATLLPFRASRAQGGEFDHFVTNFPLTGVHERVACESCHVRGIFRGTPTQCSICHSAAGLASSQKPANHIMTSAACGDCHTTNQWLGARFDHGSVTGSCVSCHNGLTAIGKSVPHIPSSNACEDCHGTISFSTASFDHDNVTGSCFSCHNGVLATGKSVNHVASSNMCEDCHSTTSWVTGSFDHSGITGNCASCHNGMAATGKSANHIATSASCETCHSTNAWIPASFDHSGVTGNCASCHNGVAATGKSAGHFTTSSDCVMCHSTSQWTPITFSHTSAAYPGDHRVDPACTDCHKSNSQVVPWISPQYQPDCAACHSNDYKAGSHKKVDSPKILYTVGELRDCSGSCHTYSDATLSTIKKSRSGHHSVNRGGW